MKLYIKNMVCDRCNMVIKSQLSDLGFKLCSVKLGEVELDQDALSDEELLLIKSNIEPLGFELLGDKKSQLIDRVKNSIIELVHRQESLEKIKISDHIRETANQDYSHVSHLFSNIEGMTIEQYYINHKIEKVKELLVYDELSTTEIAYRLGYSSLAHLSGQFKKVTGMTPSQFKKLKDLDSRLPIDKV